MPIMTPVPADWVATLLCITGGICIGWLGLAETTVGAVQGRLIEILRNTVLITL